MPPSRRQTPPVRRRPKVAGAGIRRPSPSPRPHDEEYVESEEVSEVSEVPEASEVPEVSGRHAAPEVVEGPDDPDEVAEVEPRRPTPRPKVRDGGRPKPSSYEAAEAEASAAEPDVAEPEAAGPRRKLSPYVLAGALFGLALVLTAAAVLFKIKANETEALTSNTALLDTARTAEVSQAASSAAETLFSYDFNNIAKTQNAAKDLLLNDQVKATYNNLMGEVERLAPQQKIVVTVKATRSGVIMLDGDRARAMVFVDQTATRTDQNQTSSGSAQLWLNLQYVDGKWKVSDLNTYDSEQPTPTTTPAPGAPPASPAPSR
ncbi:hypothetical protein [Amycolatopsis thermophila]|uniref:Mce-associated membrane protein n=1 Tax=Amycolatopsis thermophila TaxID=206084 RepID=A0ABU0EQL9_9PSEU|nr:hypothetical protein [Amycolatopsis thermophila]MDQ0377567.1 Mce-associated membrane protein [Amycolatopsis thermophila]